MRQPNLAIVAAEVVVVADAAVVAASLGVVTVETAVKDVAVAVAVVATLEEAPAVTTVVTAAIAVEDAVASMPLMNRPSQPLVDLKWSHALAHQHYSGCQKSLALFHTESGGRQKCTKTNAKA